MSLLTRRTTRSFAALAFTAGAVALVFPQAAHAAPAAVGLGTASSFGVLAGQGVSNTGPTNVGADLGTCPNPSVVGFPPGTVGGTIHANDAVACKAQSDLTTAYNDAAGRAPTTTYPGDTDLGGKTLVAGVYNTATAFGITGALTLDAQGDPNSVFIFQAGSTVITATNSSVSMVNGAQACNVFWQVGSSATLGVGSTMQGTVMALSAITANTNAAVDGRLLTRNAALTLDSNQVRPAPCGAGSGAPTTSATGATTSTSGATGASGASGATGATGASGATGATGGVTTTSDPTGTVTDLATTTTTSAAVNRALAVTTTTRASGQVGPDVQVEAASINNPAAAQTLTATAGGSLASSGGIATWQPVFGFFALLLGAALLSLDRLTDRKRRV